MNHPAPEVVIPADTGETGDTPPAVTMPAVAGLYLGHAGDGRGFVYQYTCQCGRDFVERTPEVSAPALCHRCYAGGRSARGR